MARRYKIRGVRSRRKSLKRSNAGPIIALLSVILGVLLVVFAIVYYAIPFVRSLIDEDYRPHYLPTPSPTPYVAPTPTPHPMSHFDPFEAQTEVVIDNVDYKWFTDPYYYNERICFSGGVLAGDDVQMNTLFFCNTDGRSYEIYPYTPKNTHLLSPAFNGEWLVFTDAKAEGGGFIMAVDMTKENASPTVVKEFYTGLPELRLYDHYIAWTERTGTRMDKLFVCDLETHESTTLAMLSSTPYGQSLPSFHNGNIAWAAESDDSTAEAPVGMISYYNIEDGTSGEYKCGTYVHDPEYNGEYFAWLTSHHSPDCELYIAKADGTPKLIASGVVEYGLCDDFIVYGQGESIWAYFFDNERTYRISTEDELAQFLGASNGCVFWMDVSLRSRDILKFAKLPA